MVGMRLAGREAGAQEQDRSHDSWRNSGSDSIMSKELNQLLVGIQKPQLWRGERLQRLGIHKAGKGPWHILKFHHAFWAVPSLSVSLSLSISLSISLSHTHTHTHTYIYNILTDSNPLICLEEGIIYLINYCWIVPIVTHTSRRN